MERVRVRPMVGTFDEALEDEVNEVMEADVEVMVLFFFGWVF